LSTLRSGPQCPTMIKAIADYIDDALKGKLNKDETQYVIDLFGIKDIEYGDFMYYFADIFAAKV
jgi:hypothetical protein